MPSPTDTSTKEIAVTVRPSKEQVKDADFLAQADQKGSGEFREQHLMSSDMPSPMQADATTGESELESLEKDQQKRQSSRNSHHLILHVLACWRQRTLDRDIATTGWQALTLN